MFSLRDLPNPLYRRCYAFAAAGFLAISAGYLLRGQIVTSHSLVSLFLGVFPNLLGSFATPFLLVVLLQQRFPGTDRFAQFWTFGLVNLFVFAVSVLIEVLHIVFGLGLWDTNDIIASLTGGLGAMVVFEWTRRQTLGQQKTAACYSEI